MEVLEVFTWSRIVDDDRGDVAVPMAGGEPRVLYPVRCWMDLGLRLGVDLSWKGPFGRSQRRAGGGFYRLVC